MRPEPIYGATSAFLCDGKGTREAGPHRPSDSKEEVSLLRGVLSWAIPGKYTDGALSTRGACIENGVFAVLTCCYWHYRHHSNPMWGAGSGPFAPSVNDVWGAVFLAAYVVFGRVGFLVYAVNPIRNVVMAMLQARIPVLALEMDERVELYRDILSAACQLCIALALLCLTLRSARRPLALQSSEGRFSAAQLLCTSLLVAVAVVASYQGLLQNTDGFRYWIGHDHCLKIIFAVCLGVSEEITWREVFRADTCNSCQAFVWGMNHFVVPDRLYSPWMYGLAAFSYGFVSGSSPYRIARYSCHTAIEYVAVNRLVGATLAVVAAHAPASVALFLQL